MGKYNDTAVLVDHFFPIFQARRELFYGHGICGEIVFSIEPLGGCSHGNS